jgi:Uma2 family endonuclease
MALAERGLKHHNVLTYDDYLKEGETPGRYEIINGVREYMTTPVPDHQLIAGNLLFYFKVFEMEKSTAITISAPCDILISQNPLQVRQPDLLLISFERWKNRDGMIPGPIPAPELVVEVLSPSEAYGEMDSKIADFGSAGVTECWIVSPEARTIEVLTFGAGETKRIKIYGTGESLTSIAFPALIIDVSSIFKLITRQS